MPKFYILFAFVFISLLALATTSFIPFTAQSLSSKVQELDSDLAQLEAWSNQISNRLAEGKLQKGLVDVDSPFMCQGRLTYTSNTPVTTADVTAATTLYFTPYHGERVALYNGTNWTYNTFTQRSYDFSTLPTVANTNYDVFLHDSSGTLTLSLTAWTDNTTRATDITLQDGVYVKSGATTRRYLGTLRITNTINQGEDSTTKRFLWNYYNRVTRPMGVTETTDSWRYDTATVRSANGSTANRVEFVVGVDEELTSAETQQAADNDDATQTYTLSAVGLDSTSTNSSQLFGGLVDNNCRPTVYSSYNAYTGIGYRFIQWVEKTKSNGSDAVYHYGDDAGSDFIRAGMVARIRG